MHGAVDGAAERADSGAYLPGLFERLLEETLDEPIGDP
jgi:hypothetical protein